MLGKPRAHSERTFAHKSAHLRKRAHISKVPASTFVCHNSARAENCKTYTFHDHEHKFKRTEKSVLLKIQAQIYRDNNKPFIYIRIILQKNTITSPLPKVLLSWWFPSMKNGKDQRTNETSPSIPRSRQTPNNHFDFCLVEFQGPDSKMQSWKKMKKTLAFLGFLHSLYSLLPRYKGC